VPPQATAPRPAGFFSLFGQSCGALCPIKGKVKGRRRATQRRKRRRVGRPAFSRFSGKAAGRLLFPPISAIL